MVWPAVIAAGAALAGSFIGGNLQNKTNRSIAREQMHFQERMSNSAFQRAMSDMRKAGLNPILAYKQGGATTPTGAGIPAQNVLGPAVQSAVSTYQNIKAAEATGAATKLTQQQERLERAKADRFDMFGDSITGRNAHTAWAMLNAGVNAKKKRTPSRRTRVEKLPGETYVQAWERKNREDRKRARSRSRAPSDYRKPRPGEKAGSYFSAPR